MRWTSTKVLRLLRAGIMVFIMFAIVALRLMSGKFYSCNDGNVWRSPWHLLLLLCNDAAVHSCAPEQDLWLQLMECNAAAASLRLPHA